MSHLDDRLVDPSAEEPEERDLDDRDLTERPNRLPLFALGAVALAALIWLGMDAFQGSVVYYVHPGELTAAHVGEHVRLAGEVVDGTIARDDAGVLTFEVTDGTATVPVRFDGRAPDSLTDGSEAVSEGALGPDGVFHADTVLARCASRFEADLEP
jgi:cytochrome c-type biogenesis protein CcmE